MTESVILNTPLLWLGYGAALFFCVYGLVKRDIKGVLFPVLSVLLCVMSTAAALLSGASYYEVTIPVLMLLALNLTAYFDRGGEDK